VTGLDQDLHMTTKERAVDVGSRRGSSIILELGRELRMARLDHGLSQVTVARAARTSRSQVGRIEHGEAQRVSIVEISRLLAVVGLELSARAYPAGPPIRDAAHGALLDRFRKRVAPSVAWRFEVPVGHVGDQRAWDAVLLIGRDQVAVEAETRPRDVQVLQRRLAAKRRDDPEIAAVVLLLAATRYNRALLKEYGPALRADFPLDGGSVLAALAEGRGPGGSGIVLA
jgi:transcriptional regulator with XRE-family HTH domain